MTSSIEILITLSVSQELLEQLEQVSERVKVTLLPAENTREIPPEVWKRAEVLYTARVLPEPEQAPALRWIQFYNAGVEWALETPIVQKPDVISTTLSGSNAPQVAEYALMMMLNLGRHMPALFAYQARAEWPADVWDRFLPHELRGSTVGLVGYGSIGREIARLLQPFGVTILAAKRDVMQLQDTGFYHPGTGDPEGNLFHRLYPIQALRSMLKECDFVVVVLPLTPSTRGLVSTAELAAMKPSAFLIDVGRGGVVDDEALAIALQERRLAGAGLDVFSEEPLPPDHPLWKMPNVAITPHFSGISPHYAERGMAVFAENLSRYLSGAPLLNRIELERGY